jgi:hypothetical protein
MGTIRWDGVPDGEVRAEVEASLESQGESKRIRAFLSQSPAMTEWRQEIRQLVRQLITEIGIDNLTSDILYDHIAAQAHEIFPAELSDEVKAKLSTFLQSQFEDHI